LKVIFNLDGTGVFYDPVEPIMLDALLGAALARWHVHGEPPARDEEPFDIPLPLRRWEIEGVWGWHASALFPDAAVDEEIGESLVSWRQRFRSGRAERLNASPNLTQGIYREWNMEVPYLLVPRLIGYCYGERAKIKRTLTRDIKYLGKKRAQGRGAITSIEVEVIDDDYSIVKDNRTTRWLPHPDGSRLVRPRPPYWNTVGTVNCLEIGAPWGD